MKPLVKNNAQEFKVDSRKSYAQVSKPSFNTSKVLKIKKTFPLLNAEKINQVNSIVNG